MGFGEYAISGPRFRARCTNKLESRRLGAATCTACVRPCGLDPAACRITWTPDPTVLFNSILNGWSGDSAVDRVSLPSIYGSQVISTDPWQLTTVAVGGGETGLRFSQPVAADGPMLVSTDLDSFSYGPLPDMAWLFIDDANTSCTESAVAALPEVSNSVVREIVTTTPGPLNDADLQALGVTNGYPAGGGPLTIRGPLLRFVYTENISAVATFSFNHGQHRLGLNIDIRSEIREEMECVALEITGSYPNRVGTFSRLPPFFTNTGEQAEDSCGLTFDGRWESVSRAPATYNSTYNFTETMAVSSEGFNWASTGSRRGLNGETTVNAPSAPAASTVTLPTFTDISWRRAI